MDVEWELSHDERVWDEGGWLEDTHLLTHANATRRLLQRGVTGEGLRSLYHNAWFINYQKRFDRMDGVRADQQTLPEPKSRTPEDLVRDYRAAIQAKRGEEALGIVQHWHQRELPTKELVAALGREAAEVDDGDFISNAHVLKTSHAAIQEHRSMQGQADALLPLLAATRYVASPRKQRSVVDAALNGHKFVHGGAAKSV